MGNKKVKNFTPSNYLKNKDERKTTLSNTKERNNFINDLCNDLQSKATEHDLTNAEYAAMVVSTSAYLFKQPHNKELLKTLNINQDEMNFKNVTDVLLVLAGAYFKDNPNV